MSSDRHRSPESEGLRGEYDAAFKDWALEVDQLRTVESADRDAAVERVEAAELVYRTSRDRLQESLNRHEPGE